MLPGRRRQLGAELFRGGGSERCGSADDAQFTVNEEASHDRFRLVDRTDDRCTDDVYGLLAVFSRLRAKADFFNGEMAVSSSWKAEESRAY
jgi:hypothetical protein